MLKIVENEHEDENEFTEHLDAVIQRGARAMLLAALEAEVAEYVGRHKDVRDERGHRLVVRNGKAKARKVTTGACPSG